MQIHMFRKTMQVEHMEQQFETIRRKAIPFNSQFEVSILNVSRRSDKPYQAAPQLVDLDAQLDDRRDTARLGGGPHRLDAQQVASQTRSRCEDIPRLAKLPSLHPKNIFILLRGCFLRYLLICV